MSITPKLLQERHFVSTATRQRIHELTGKPNGPSKAERQAFADNRNLRNVTKYWPWPVVLEACDLWGIEPVLTLTGRRFVKNNGGLHFDRGENTPVPVLKIKQAVEMKVSDPYAKPPVTVGGGGKAPVPGGKAPAPVAPAPVLDTDAERQRKLEALEALVARKVAEAHAADAETIKNLVAGVSGAAAQAAVETVAQQFIAQLRAENEERMQAAEALVEAARPVEIVVRTPEGRELGTLTESKGTRVHKAFARVLKLAVAGKNIAMIGPTGCGKTHLAGQVAAALSRQFLTGSCTMGMSETKLIGGYLPTGENGRWEAYLAAFMIAFRDGHAFLLDEYDSIDPNVNLILNQALANGFIDIPAVGRILRHPDFVCMAALNTYGTGADRQYVGRAHLDEASLDRFRIGQVVMDYDRDMEKGLIEGRSGFTATHRQWLKEAWRVRDRIAASRPALRRNMSTRFIIDGADMIDAGDTVEQVLSVFVTGWSEAELQQVKVTPVPLF
jgi:MoxR-like ATPase